MTIAEAVAKYNALWDRWTQTSVADETPEQTEYREKYGHRVNYLSREEVTAAVKDVALAVWEATYKADFEIDVKVEIERLFGSEGGTGWGS